MGAARLLFCFFIFVHLLNVKVTDPAGNNEVCRVLGVCANKALSCIRFPWVICGDNRESENTNEGFLRQPGR